MSDSVEFDGLINDLPTACGAVWREQTMTREQRVAAPAAESEDLS